MSETSPWATSIVQSAFFYHVLNGKPRPAVESAFARVKPKSALEIGCGLGATLPLLYHQYGVRDLLGIEKHSEIDEITAFNDYRRSLGEHTDIKSRYDHYMRYKFDARSSPSFHLPEEEFNLSMPIKYNTDIRSLYLASGRFDLIVASNVLHYLTLAEQQVVLHEMKRWATPNALFYIRIKEGFQYVGGSSFENLKFMCQRFAEERRLKVQRSVGGNEAGAHLLYHNFVM